MTTNYQALGELTAYTAQAHDAARRLRSHLRCLAGQVHAAVNFEPHATPLSVLHNTVNAAELVQRELQAALRCANQAAALCGRPDVDIGALVSRDGVEDRAIGT